MTIPQLRSGALLLGSHRSGMLGPASGKRDVPAGACIGRAG
ncbi:MAG: hypothetical protein ABWY29_03500 [Blastococcus sp.]